MRAKKYIQTDSEVANIFKKLTNDYKDSFVTDWQGSQILTIHSNPERSYSVQIVEDEVKRVREGKNVKVKYLLIDWSGIEFKVPIDYLEVIRIVNKALELDELRRLAKDRIK